MPMRRSHSPSKQMDGDHRDMANVGSSIAEEKTHSCEVKISFPTDLQAQQAIQILAVDPEPTNRVVKQFRISQEADDKNSKQDCMVV